MGLLHVLALLSRIGFKDLNINTKMSVLWHLQHVSFPFMFHAQLRTLHDKHKSVSVISENVNRLNKY